VLQEFLVDTWDQTELGREWALLEEDGEILGSQYDNRKIGRVDLLAKHRDEDRWLVIELKRGRASDVVVGQIMRYCGWVEEHLAAEGEVVEGLIISLDHDENLRYALRRAPGVRAVQYRVSFTLGDPIV
jgi:restriction system protein